MTKDVLVSISGAHMVDGDSDDVSVIDVYKRQDG